MSRKSRSISPDDLQQIARAICGQITGVDENPEETQLRIATANAPLETLIDEFERGMIARGNGKEHAKHCANRCRRVASALGATRLGHLTPAAVQRAVNQLCSLRDYEKGRPLSAVGRNHVLGAIHNLFSWLRLAGRIRENPLHGRVKRNRTKGNEVYKRRAISEQDLARLIETTEWSGPWRHAKQKSLSLDGPTRADIYRVAVACGLRANEIRQLTVGQAVLYGDDCGIRIRADQAKNRQEAFQRIPIALAERLRRYVEGRQSYERLFPKLPHCTAVMLQYDLARAGIPRITDKGVFDLHSLRKETATLLLARNVNIKVVQKIMRHSTAELTLSLYAEAQTEDLVSARDAMPTFLPDFAAPSADALSESDAPSLEVPEPIDAPACERPPVPIEPGRTTTPPVEIFRASGHNSPDEPWRVRYRTPDGRKLEEAVSSDRAMTVEYAKEIWLRLERRRLGLWPATDLQRNREKPTAERERLEHALAARLPEFTKALSQQGIKPELAGVHAKRCRRILLAMATSAGPDAPMELEPIEAAITHLRDRQTNRPLSAAAQQHHRQSFKRFLSVIGIELLQPAVPAPHRLCERLTAFQASLVKEGLSAARAKRHAQRCRRILEALGGAGGFDADASSVSIGEVINSLKDRNGQTLDPENHRYYRDSAGRFIDFIGRRTG